MVWRCASGQPTRTATARSKTCTRLRPRRSRAWSPHRRRRQRRRRDHRRQPRQRCALHPFRPGLHSPADQDRGSELGCVRDTGTAAHRPAAELARRVRPAHGRWVVQQPDPGPGRLRRLGSGLPAAARSGVPQRPGRRRRSGWSGRRAIVTNTNYASTISVVDADPRIISNLIVDQTITNPAAVQAYVDGGFGILVGGVLLTWMAIFATGLTTRHDSDTPQRDAGRGLSARLQLLVHVLRPVLRSRPRPGRQGRQRHGLHAAAAGRPAVRARPRCRRTSWC